MYRGHLATIHECQTAMKTRQHLTCRHCAKAASDQGDQGNLAKTMGSIFFSSARAKIIVTACKTLPLVLRVLICNFKTIRNNHAFSHTGYRVGQSFKSSKQTSVVIFHHRRRALPYKTLNHHTRDEWRWLKSCGTAAHCRLILRWWCHCLLSLIMEELGGYYFSVIRAVTAMAKNEISVPVCKREARRKWYGRVEGWHETHIGRSV